MTHNLKIEESYSSDLPDDFSCIECGCRNPSLIIRASNVQIGICESCLEEFIKVNCKEAMNEVLSTCWYCKHYKKNEYGRSYDGKCLCHKSKYCKEDWSLGSYMTCDNFESKNLR